MDEDDGTKIQIDPIDLQGRISALKNYINTYKDKVGTKEQKDAGISLSGQLMVTESIRSGGLDAFGGRALLCDGLVQALDTMDLGILNQYLDVLENQLPLAATMMEKYNELREAQKNKSKNKDALAKEFSSLLAQVEKGKENNSPLLIATRTALHTKQRQYGSNPPVDYRPILLKEEIAPMFEESFKEEGSKQSLGEIMKQAYQRLEECEKKAEKEPSEANKEAVLAAENQFLQAYKDVAYRQIRNHVDSAYGKITDKTKNNDFIQVMGDILSSKWTMAWKSLPKVGLGLGFKMAKALISM